MSVCGQRLTAWLSLTLCVLSSVVLHCWECSQRASSTISRPSQPKPGVHCAGNTCRQRILHPTTSERLEGVKTLWACWRPLCSWNKPVVWLVWQCGLRTLAALSEKEQCSAPLTQSASWPTSFRSKLPALSAASAQTLTVVPTPSVHDNSIMSVQKVKRGVLLSWKAHGFIIRKSDGESQCWSTGCMVLKQEFGR